MICPKCKHLLMNRFDKGDRPYCEHCNMFYYTVEELMIMVANDLKEREVL